MSIKQAIEALEELVEYAEEAGFDWSLDNARAALAALRSMPQGEPANSVKMPTSEDEAALMVLTGVSWLKYNAPHRLKDATQPAEAVRMSEAEIEALFQQAADADEEVHIRFARAVEQATAARLGVKMGDV